MATPALAALLWLGAFPPLHIIALGLLTTFSGYTAVYALNDVVDYRTDREKISRANQRPKEAGDIDALWVRHPMAQGLLSYREGVLWATGWSVVAIIGAALLNPVCILIFVLGCLLETAYCLLLKITHHRVLISGGVKTSGALAAVFAVDPSPGTGYLLCLFLLFFFWEIGGQNVPNDWTDMEEDRRIRARTIPIRFGPEKAIRIILATLSVSTILTPVLFHLSRASFGPAYLAASLAGAAGLLILPAWRLCRSKNAASAMALFNRASCLPLALLCLVLVKLIF
jgi:4-hydroxybenzoate polyprenyltransferase